MSRSLVTRDLLSCVIAIGVYEQGEMPKIVGSGVLIGYENYTFVVTVKHIINGLLEQSQELCFFNNTKDGNISVKSYQFIKKISEQDWIDHPDPKIDLTVSFFAFNPDVDAVKIIPQQLFAQENEIEIGAEVYVLGYPHGISTSKSVIPIVRYGLVAGKSTEGHYLVDSAIYEGNSGGPIFLRPTILTPDGNVVIGGQMALPKLIGFVKSILKNKKSESLQLSEIVGIQKLKEILSSSKFKSVIADQQEKYQQKENKTDD